MQDWVCLFCNIQAHTSTQASKDAVSSLQLSCEVYSNTAVRCTAIAGLTWLQTTLKSKLIIDSLGPTRCRQTLQGSVDVLMTGIGRTAEKIIVQQLAKVYESIPAVIDR